MGSFKDYKEGAKALLGLNKKKEEEEEEGAVAADANNNNNNNTGDAPNNDDKERENVEAALMRIVGGTLSSEAAEAAAQASSQRAGSAPQAQKKSNKRKKSFSANDNIDEFQHWNQFLVTEQDDDAQETQVPKMKKSKKSKNRPDQTPSQSLDVDPELEGIQEDQDAHIQLVRDVIMDADQLEEDVNIHDYIQNPHEDTSLESTIAQAAAAAMASQEIEKRRPVLKQSKKKAGASSTSASALAHVSLQQQQSSQASNNGDVTALVSEAADKASSAVSGKSEGKMFSREECDAIEKFVSDYSQINGMTRDELCDRVWSNDRKRDDFWESVHRVLPYRTRASVYKHVRRTYHVFALRGKWTEEEDRQLAELVATKDTQWKAIGGLMGRMPEDCRDRWRNYLKCGKQRAQNKWNEDEEFKLKEIVLKMKAITHGDDTTINWTVVSEQMNGIRSRIQCRYKWNKLLKRDASIRAASMGFNDKLWMLNKLQELGFDPEDQVNWEALSTLQEKSEWTAQDLRSCYEKMKQSVKDHKNKGMTEICQALLHDIVQDTDEEVQELPVVFYRGGKIEPAPVDPLRERQQQQTKDQPTQPSAETQQTNNQIGGEYIKWR